MGYEIYFEFKNDKDKIKYSKYCDKKKIDSELFWTRGWDKRDLSDYFKSIGKSKVKKSSDNQFEWRYWVLKVSDLESLSNTYKVLKDNGIIELIDDYPSDYDGDLEDYFYNEILGWKYETYANDLIENIDKFTNFKNESTIKAIRLADLEYASKLRDRKDELNNNFKKRLEKALSNTDYLLKDYIKENLPLVFWDLERFDEMYQRLLKVVDKGTELTFNESY